MARFYDILPSALASGQPFALGIICAIKGSSPQKKGAKALFFADGRIAGTLGGGCLEAEIQDRARRALLTQTPATFELVLDHDFGWDDGLICGGKVSGLILPHAAQAGEIWKKLAGAQQTLAWGVKNDFSISWVEHLNDDWLYQETVTPPCALWVAGAGHVAQGVVPLALQLDFDVTVFDDRPTLASHQYFPEPTRLQTGPWGELLTEPSPDRPAFGLIVTRGHQHDALVLQNWIHRPFVFLGMLGSRRKARLFAEQFIQEKLATEEEFARVACPVGIDIGAVSVNEIALSIVAQLVHTRAEKVLGVTAQGHGQRAVPCSETAALSTIKPA